MTPRGNAALRWFHSRLGAFEMGGHIHFAGQWQEAWKRDFSSGRLPATRAVLSLYDDAAREAHELLGRSGIYCEATMDEAVIARLRIMQAGFKDSTVTADEHQRYIWARK